MKRIMILLTVFLLLSALSFPQGASDIYGTVVLPDGSAIPGVAINLTSELIGTKTTVTSEEGNYRFIQLPPGSYDLTFQLDGFKTVNQKGVRLLLGKNQVINVTLETSSLKEEVTISGQTTVVDVRKTNVGVNISGEQLRALPTARNPWTMLSLVPGMMMDRQDVGGADSGQQSNFYGNGAAAGDTQWNIDGANLTDSAALGAAPAYLNMNSYEEMQVNIGANDISAMTGGAQINFVSKRGGNRFSGDFHLYAQDKAWELEQKVPEELASSGFISPGINRLKQYGINFGGPILKEKLWFIGSYSIQDIVARTLAGQDDTTLLVSGYAKLNFQLANLSGELQFTNDDKLKWGRLRYGATQQDPDSFWDQYGPTRNYRASLQYVTGNLMLSAKGIYTDGGFTLDPRGADVNPANGHNEGREFYRYALPNTYITNNYQYGADRNSVNIGADGNYFLENTLGGDHEFKFGVDYYRADSLTETLYPNQRVSWIWDKADPLGSEKEVWLVSDGITNVYFDRLSVYLQDTVTFGRLTANVGLRYDHEQGYYADTTAQGLSYDGVRNDWTNKWLPDITVPGGKVAGSRYNVISPRLSLSYDITGDGKNLIKLSLARYGTTNGIGHGSDSWMLGQREIDVVWNDTNNDLVPQIDELGLGGPESWSFWSINEQNPSSVASRDRYDPDYNSPLLDELTLSFEKAIGSDIAVSLTGFYKKRHNLVWYRNILEADASGTPLRLDSLENYYVGKTQTLPDGSSRDLYYSYEYGKGMYFTNMKESYQRYLGAQLVFTKKLANNWMADVSLSLQDWRNFWDRNEFVGNSNWDIYSRGVALTNYDYFNEGSEAPEPTGSGQNGVFVNARWEFKVNGLYQLPGGINLTAVFQSREGYVIPYRQQVMFPNGVGRQWVYQGGKKIGDDRLPAFWMINLGLEKTFRISDVANVTLLVNGYNVTNNNTTLQVNPTLGSSTTGQINRILNAGNFQFGVRVNF